MKRALLALLAVAGCPSSAPPAKPDVDLFVPRMPDAGTLAETKDTSEAKEPPMSDDKGWLLTEDGPTSPQYTDRSVVLQAIKASTQRALIVADESIEECSSAGGSHVFFRLLEHRVVGAKSPPLTKDGVVHYGGHGAMMMLQAFPKGGVWVASIKPLPRPTSVKNEPWCVPDRTIHARAVALVPVASREAGLELLRSL